MTVMDPTAPAGPASRPFRLTMLLPTLVVDTAAPIAILKILESLGVPPVWALAAGCLPPLANNLHSWVRSRRLEAVGLFVMGSMATGVAASLVSGDLMYQALAGSVLNAVWGLVFLGSLLLRRPVIFYLLRQLVAGTDATRIEIWNGLWNYGIYRRALKVVTAACGLLCFGEAIAGWVLARGLGAETAATVSPIVNLVATLAMLVFIRLYLRMARTRLERAEPMTWPL